MAGQFVVAAVLVEMGHLQSFEVMVQLLARQQALAQAVPTVVGETTAMQGFIHQQNCLLVPQANPQALAMSLRWAFENRSKLSDIGQKGRQLYQEQLSLAVVAQGLDSILQKFQP